MENHRILRTIFIVLSIAALVAAIISLLKAKGINIDIRNDGHNENQNDNHSSSSSSSISSSSANASSSWGWPLMKGTGSKANPSGNVKSIQEALNWYLKNDIAKDGIWGDITERSLISLRSQAYPAMGAALSFGTVIPMDGGNVSLDKEHYQMFITLYSQHKSQKQYENII